MKANLVKAALKTGQIVYGSELSGLPTTEVVRMYAAAGFDFVFIDMEHSALTINTVTELIRSARVAGICPIVRVPQAEYVWVARVLDNGAQGIIVPRVNTPRQVEEIVSWTRYPPLGVRGFADTAAQTDGETVQPDEFIRHANEHTLLVIQFERQEAIDNLDAMLSIPGVDVACLGYMDLSVDLGVPGQVLHPKMMDAVGKLVEVAAKKNIASGIITADFDNAARWVKRGMRFVSYATDAILLRSAAADAVKRLRDLRND